MKSKLFKLFINYDQIVIILQIGLKYFQKQI